MKKNILQKFKKNGFVIGKIFSNKEIKTIEIAIFRPFEILSKFLELGDWKKCKTYEEKLLLLEAIKNKDPKSYMNALKISQNDPNILSIPSNKKLQNFLNKIGLCHPVVCLKTYPILLSSKIFVKNGYNIRPVHQEWPVMQGSYNGVVMWFPLHNVNKNSSGIEIYPRSHTNGVYPYRISECGSKIETNYVKKMGEPKKIFLKKGEAVFFSAFTAHRSFGNFNNLRVAISIRFNDIYDNNFINRKYIQTDQYKINKHLIDNKQHRFVIKKYAK